MQPDIQLKPLQREERECFIQRNQAAFMKAVVETYGPQEHEAIPRQDIICSLDAPNAEAFQILCGGKTAGGVIVQIDRITHRHSLDILFIDPDHHSHGIGLSAWNAIEQMYPETVVWETHTPYFETRNIHFYVNKCGFHIVEFFNPKHPDPHQAGTPGGEFFFRFEKHMK